MKKLRNIALILLVCFLCIPQVYAASAGHPMGGDYEYVSCGSVKGIPKPVPEIISLAFTLLVIVAPIILIIFSIVALVKAITAGSADDIMKAKGKLIKKFIAAGFIFLVAGITQFVVTHAVNTNEKSGLMSCISCFLYNDGCSPSEDPNAEGD